MRHTLAAALAALLLLGAPADADEPFRDLTDRELLALTLGMESATPEGQRAVMAVIANRVTDPRWPDTLRAALSQPNQFAPTSDPLAARKWLSRPLSGRYGRAVALAVAAEWPPATDPTGGATHFECVACPTPWWAANMTETVRIGGNVFYVSE